MPSAWPTSSAPPRPSRSLSTSRTSWRPYANLRYLDRMQTEALKVYWRPGCSSCVRVKEFLTGLGVKYESVNVSATPEAMEDLLRLGVRTVPVVARGKDYVFAQELADVSEFIGRKVEFRRLPAQELAPRWLHVLGSAQRYVMQL